MEPEQDGASLWIYGPNEHPLVFSILNQKLQNKWSFPFPLTTSTQIKN
jgi:hypothetical protein